MSSTSIMEPPPAVKVGGKDYRIRFSNGAFYLLSKWGIDVTQISRILNEMFQENRYTEAMYKLAAAGLGNQNAAGNWKTAGIDPLELADTLLDGEADLLMEVTWQAFAGKLGLDTTTKTMPTTAPANNPPTPANSESESGASTGVSG
jgi:hypothetical protein